MKLTTRKLLVYLGLMAVLAQSALAFRPSGWVYGNYPWAYASDSGDWYWFNTSDTQWIANMGNGQWANLPNSALASGWGFYQPPFAYSQGNSAWHYINEVDTQWVVNMRTGDWSRFGTTTAPAGMVLIHGGTNAGTDPDFGTYSLTVSSFYMDKYEVTKALWDEVKNWAIANGYSFYNIGSGKASNHPVQTVNWYDVVKWCNARSQKEGRSPVYTVNGSVYKSGQSDNVVQTSAAGYRLPTDVEWEYAARGGISGRRFPWGTTITHSQANYNSSSVYSYDTSSTRGYHPTYSDGILPYTSPVGSFAANGYGLYDMAGNVWEWCFDWQYAGSYRVVRGGSWNYDAYFCRGAIRYGFIPVNDFWSNLGFRTVLPIGQQ